MSSPTHEGQIDQGKRPVRPLRVAPLLSPVAEYLLDTTTFSFFSRDDAKVRARVNALVSGDGDVVHSIVRGEIVYGIERPAAERRRTDLG